MSKNLRLIDDCLVVLWLIDPACSDVEAVEAVALAAAAVDVFSELVGELALELSDEEGSVEEVGLLHGLLGLEFSLDVSEVSWD